MRSFILSVLSLPLLALAEPALSPYVLHEKRSSIPQGWGELRKPTTLLPLRFGLTQPGLADIDAHLNAVSHPKSPTYGQHWTAGQVAAAFAPAPESISTVYTWLASELSDGPQRVRLTKTKGWIEVNVTVEEAERLLQADYRVYGHEASGTEHVACESYHLPAHIKPHVELVTPTVHFNAVIRKRSDPSAAPARTIGQPSSGVVAPKTAGKIAELFSELEYCDVQITPACLRALYGLVYEPVAASQNSFGIVEYTPQAYIQSDLDMFATNFSTGLEGVAPLMVSIDGGYAQQEYTGFDYNGESNLDLEYGMTLVTAKQNVTLYQAGDMVEGASFNNLLDALDGTYCTFEGGDDPTQDGIYPDPYTNYTGAYEGPESCGIVKPANVISTSYGYNEADLTPFYTARQCAEYAKLGLMGVTVLYSSGDYGVAGNDDLCLFANGTQSVNGTMFNPSFPGTCPYITSVGATQVNPNSTVYEPEGACEQVIYSGGGFSNYFAMPSYQAEAVAMYYKNYAPPYGADVYNNSMTSRGYPDIAANGANYVVAIDGEFELVYGTSCSSPVSASILTMVNDARLAVGKKPIGFINPTIYSSDFQGVFNDITMGTNQGCGTEGFTAVPGWDPVTGLGTPNFPKLVAKWLLLP